MNEILKEGVYKILIIIVEPSLEPGWLKGTLNGKTGLVPKNYVEQLP